MSGSGTAQRQARASLGGLLTATVLATAVLHTAGNGPLSGPPLAHPGEWGAWLAQREPVAAAMALVRLVALVTGWYLLAAGLLGIAVRQVRAVRLITVADRLTIPSLRRLLASAVGITLATSVSPSFVLLAGPKLPAAVAPPAPSRAAAAGHLLTTTTTTPTSDEAARPPPTVTMRLLPADGAPPVPAQAEPAGGREEPVAVVQPGAWRVQPGDCFWSIAEGVLRQAWGRQASDAEIVPYWRGLIEANRDVLADRANPDLVFPGQVFTVPTAPALPGE